MMQSQGYIDSTQLACAAGDGTKAEALPQHSTKPIFQAHGVLMTCAVAVLQSGKVALEQREDLLQRAEPRICAFDIETTKLPLQFPNSEHDQVQRPSHLSTEQSFISSASSESSWWLHTPPLVLACRVG